MVGKRFVVLGRRDDIENWRKERGLGRRQVIEGSSGPALRGFSGPIEVVTLPSFASLPAAVQRELLLNIELIQATTPHG